MIARSLTTLKAVSLMALCGVALAEPEEEGEDDAFTFEPNEELEILVWSSALTAADIDTLFRSDRSFPT